MSYTLLKFSEDWADEFQVEGFIVVETAYVTAIESLVLKMPNLEANWYFGTNKCFDMSPKDLFNCYSKEAITENEAYVLQKLFGNEVGIHLWDSLCDRAIDTLSDDEFLDFSREFV